MFNISNPIHNNSLNKQKTVDLKLEVSEIAVDLDKSKVELKVHSDGCFRHVSLYNLDYSICNTSLYNQFDYSLHKQKTSN